MSNTNMAQAMANAAANAKSPNALEQRNAQAAKASKAAPDTDVLAAIMARLNALETANAALTQENAVLKSGKAAPQAEKKAPPVYAANCTYTHDAKAGKLTIVVDLNADITDEATGAPKVSASGKTTAVAGLNGRFADKRGREVGVSVNAYTKIAN